MKKDIFNGKVKPEYRKSIICLMIFASILFIVVATLFLLLAILYDKVDYSARIALYVISAVSYVFAVFYPLITVLCIIKYPKYKKLTKLFIKSYALIDDVENNNLN